MTGTVGGGSGATRMVRAAITTRGRTMMTKLDGNSAHKNIPIQAAARLLVFLQRGGPSKVNRNPIALKNPISPEASITKTTPGESWVSEIM